MKTVIAAKQEALTELRAVSEELYQQAIQVGIGVINTTFDNSVYSKIIPSLTCQLIFTLHVPIKIV